jgi:hypothetical protein
MGASIKTKIFSLTLIQHFFCFRKKAYRKNFVNDVRETLSDQIFMVIPGFFRDTTQRAERSAVNFRLPTVKVTGK